MKDVPLIFVLFMSRDLECEEDAEEEEEVETGEEEEGLVGECGGVGEPFFPLLQEFALGMTEGILILP
jgi:hypothetical protein